MQMIIIIVYAPIEATPLYLLRTASGGENTHARFLKDSIPRFSASFPSSKTPGAHSKECG